MDLYDSDVVSSESSGAEVRAGVLPLEEATGQRDNLGRCAELLVFSGQCVGDDVS